MKHVTYTCDKCGKTVKSAYWCHMSYALYDAHGYTTTMAKQDMDVCYTCLNRLKKMFNKKKTEAEA